jgi:hypothetical protein
MGYKAKISLFYENQVGRLLKKSAILLLDWAYLKLRK